MLLKLDLSAGTQTARSTSGVANVAAITCSDSCSEQRRNEPKTCSRTIGAISIGAALSARASTSVAMLATTPSKEAKKAYARAHTVAPKYRVDGATVSSIFLDKTGRRHPARGKSQANAIGR
mmetsp:Transcript_14207/g.34638  ORF Transcript_14207/g.34638 Transcript_14207/m.34638 type:complete len:122 (-) Transcript_14207:1553-1918(-)